MAVRLVGGRASVPWQGPAFHFVVLDHAVRCLYPLVTSLRAGRFMNDTGFLGCDFNAPAIYTPLDALVSEYQEQRDSIEQIAAYVASREGVMEHFLCGARVEHSLGNYTATTLFAKAPAIRALDARFWSRAMQLTDILETMPAALRNEWSRQIKGNTTPPFSPDTVRSTLTDLLNSRSQFFADRVDGLFHALSDDHATNLKFGFSKRMIIGWMLNYTHISHETAFFIHDLRSVIARFSGLLEPCSKLTYSALDYIHTNGLHGQWHSFDGGNFRIKLFKKGTAHLEVHPQMAYRLNQILAWKNPTALPEQVLKRPSTTHEAFERTSDLVKYDVLSELNNLRFGRDLKEATCSSPLSKEARSILLLLGGIPESETHWSFTYAASPIVEEVIRSATIPRHAIESYRTLLDRLNNQPT